jgi:hypothetical protein
VTIDHKQAIQSRTTARHADRHPPAPLLLPERDVRRKRPPFFSFLLRRETLRRISRVVSR